MSREKYENDVQEVQSSDWGKQSVVGRICDKSEV